jgi:hypothetical protein
VNLRDHQTIQGNQAWPRIRLTPSPPRPAPPAYDKY